MTVGATIGEQFSPRSTRALGAEPLNGVFVCHADGALISAILHISIYFPPPIRGQVVKFLFRKKFFLSIFSFRLFAFALLGSVLSLRLPAFSTLSFSSSVRYFLPTDLAPRDKRNRIPLFLRREKSFSIS